MLTCRKFYIIFAHAFWNLETLVFRRRGNRSTRRKIDILEQRKEAENRFEPGPVHIAVPTVLLAPQTYIALIIHIIILSVWVSYDL